MTDKIYQISEIKDIVSPIARQYGVTKVYLFGSYARGCATAESDLDFRVDAENIKGFFALGGLYNALEEAFDKSIDLVTTEALQERKNDLLTIKFYNHIKNDEVLIYERSQ